MSSSHLTTLAVDSVISIHSGSYDNELVTSRAEHTWAASNVSRNTCKTHARIVPQFVRSSEPRARLPHLPSLGIYPIPLSDPVEEDLILTQIVVRHAFAPSASGVV